MMQKISAKKLWARRGDGPGKRALGPGVPEEVRSSSGDSRSRFPLASNILQKTNTRQTTKKQPRNTNPTRTHLACRQARCGSINILGPRASRHWCAIGSSNFCAPVPIYKPSLFASTFSATSQRAHTSSTDVRCTSLQGAYARLRRTHGPNGAFGAQWPKGPLGIIP